uniref:Uncharacterized protein n=1 Tax=Arundo donax TaxID=35708 RepID=A0A0A9FQA4_ARUDO
MGFLNLFWEMSNRITVPHHQLGADFLAA